MGMLGKEAVGCGTHSVFLVARAMNASPNATLPDAGSTSHSSPAARHEGGMNPELQRRPKRKRRRWPLVVIAFLTICCAAGGAAVYTMRSDAIVDVTTQRPVVGEFFTDIVERGELESAANVELRCEVASSEGVRILEIVAEGTPVAAGDVVVQLDDSTLRKDLATQKIAVNTAEAAFSKATNDHAAALIALKEYELGTFVQEEQKLESELFVAEENSRRAENFLKHSRKLASRGYITDVQLESDRFSVEKFGKDLAAAKTKLNVIREYTKPKTLKKHDSDTKTAAASMSAEQSKLGIEQEKLTNLESQLGKCVIKAPSAGQVVFANQNRWRGDEFLVRKGNRVRERQVIVMLPDSSKMQVKTKVGEARVDRVKPGMLAVVQIEALRGTELKGTVKTVNAYASDQNWVNPNVKEFDAIVTLDAPPAMLKPGMSSKVSIRVETQTGVMQVPVQTVVERGEKHYCVIREATGKLALRDVQIGSTNDKFIIIKEGLSATDEVVMNPRAHLAAVGLKEEDVSKKKDNAATNAVPAEPAMKTTSAAVSRSILVGWTPRPSVSAGGQKAIDNCKLVIANCKLEEGERLSLTRGCSSFCNLQLPIINLQSPSLSESHWPAAASRTGIRICRLRGHS